MASRSQRGTIGRARNRPLSRCLASSTTCGRGARSRRTLPVDVEVNGQLVGQQAFTPASGRVQTRSSCARQARPGQIGWSCARGCPAPSIGRRPHAITTIASRSSRRDRARWRVSRKYFCFTPVTERAAASSIAKRRSAARCSLAICCSCGSSAAGSKDWRYLMLDDPLPAGMEAVQDADAYELERPPRVVVWQQARVP